jgi:2'-5' RNA ligase
MRAFIALDFENSIKRRIAEYQNQFRDHTTSGRWKYIDNFHLTLKFLDDISDSQFILIDRALREICAGTGSFDLNISETGSFPGKGNIRVLWLGIGGDLDKLGRLQDNISKNLEELGFPREFSLKQLELLDAY